MTGPYRRYKSLRNLDDLYLLMNVAKSLKRSCSGSDWSNLNVQERVSLTIILFDTLHTVVIIIKNNIHPKLSQFDRL